MMYTSTRGAAAPISFLQAIESGLAPDGGLYVPTVWPQLSVEDFQCLSDAPFSDVAADMLAAFASPGEGVTSDSLRPLMREAYATFDHPETAPLRDLGDDLYLLELFHGPTLAFKDVAMQALSRLYPLARRDKPQRKTILCATSGDTGGAAIAAFADAPGVDLFVLHPEGRISDVQRRIMTVNPGANIHNIAIKGSFDDCQSIVKTLFIDPALNDELDLGGVNSINWVRLAAQTSYYVTSIAKLGLSSAPAFIVPTGNFGDVFAGYAAKKTGLPVGRFGVAVNENDIMHRVLSTGEYAPAGVRATSSPSMDIQVASNFERLIFEAMGRDGARLASLMDEFAHKKSMTIPGDVRSQIDSDFTSARADDRETAEKIAEIHKRHDILIDPHTAVGLVAADKMRASQAITGPMVVLSTAHPAKFPKAVEAACGVHPGLPERYEDLHSRSERFEVLPAVSSEVSKFIRGRKG